MKNKVRIYDFLILINWVKVYQLFELKRFDYQRIMNSVEKLYSNGVEYFDVTEGDVNNLMTDAYKIYTKIVKSKKIIENGNYDIKSSYLNNELLFEEVMKFEKIIEYMLETIKYDDAKIRDIQKGYFIDKMNLCVEVEDYENAAKYRDLVKEI